MTPFDWIVFATAVVLILVAIGALVLGIRHTAHEIRQERKAKGRMLEVMPSAQREFPISNPDKKAAGASDRPAA